MQDWCTLVTCGYIKAYNVSVSYSNEGGTTVGGLTSTDLCFDHGDSGAGMFSYDHDAVGVGSGFTTKSCSNGSFRSYYSPVTDAVSHFQYEYPYLHIE